MVPGINQIIFDQIYPKSGNTTVKKSDLAMAAKAYVQTLLWEAVSSAWKTFREGIHEQAIDSKKTHELRQIEHQAEEGIIRSQILRKLNGRQAAAFDSLCNDISNPNFI